MTLNRFKDIMRYLRFDNKNTRAERVATDKLAPIRDVWEIFIAQLHKHYIPGPDLTVDEQLIAFRGRRPFRQYMPAKPAKYGIKVWWNCDSATSFPLNGQVCLGKQQGGQREIDQGKRVIHDIKPWYRSGRNIVADNFFCSIPLAEELLHEQLTLVGTVRRNKPEIPVEMQPSRSRPEKSSLFAFSGNLTLVSYVPKLQKAVILISTMHHDMELQGDKRKPAIISHYNETKGGVDNLDHLCSMFSVKRKTRRWPLVVFFNMLDVSGVAAFVIWIANYPDWQIKRHASRRRKFIVELGTSLVDEQIKRRLQNPSQIRKQSRRALRLLGYVDDHQPRTAQPAGKKRCYLCPREVDRKTRTHCDDCGNNVCQEHSSTSTFCDECL